MRNKKTIAATLLLFAFPITSVISASSNDYILDDEQVSSGSNASSSAGYFLEGGITVIETRGESEEYYEQPVITAECGNGLIEMGEACEDGQFNGISCATYGFDEGYLVCGYCHEIDHTNCHNALPPSGENNSGGSNGQGSSGGKRPPIATPQPHQGDNMTTPAATPFFPVPSKTPATVSPQVKPATLPPTVSTTRPLELSTPSQTPKPQTLPFPISPPNSPHDRFLENSGILERLKEPPRGEENARAADILGENSEPRLNSSIVNGIKAIGMIPELPPHNLITEVQNTLNGIFLPLTDFLSFQPKHDAKPRLDPNAFTEATYGNKPLITTDHLPLIVGKTQPVENAYLKITDGSVKTLLKEAIEQNAAGAFAFLPEKPLPEGTLSFRAYSVKRFKSTPIWERTVIIGENTTLPAVAQQIPVELEGSAIAKHDSPTNIGNVLKKRNDTSSLKGKTLPNQKIIGIVEKETNYPERSYAAQLFSFRKKEIKPVEAIADANGNFEIALGEDYKTGKYSLRLASLIDDGQFEYIIPENVRRAVFTFAMHPLFDPIPFDYAEPPSLFRYTLITALIGLSLIGLFLAFAFQRRMPRPQPVKRAREKRTRV